MVDLRSEEPINISRIVNDNQVLACIDDGYLFVPDLMTHQELNDLKEGILKLAKDGIQRNR